ncbi:MAG: carbonic anhydrase [Planctomycetota bacterium]|nr:carbonic anhydrase [Planctomycetota bacterium]MDA1212040.1 carbonic anhydrase [Planctomycetota bacterium]
MEKIVAGVQHFRTVEFNKHRTFYEQMASRQQNPIALFITCSDSRVMPHLITQTDPGDLFQIRNAGNIVPPYSAAGGGEGATIEYSLEVLGIKHIIVCGHSQCGAIKAILDGGNLEGLPAAKSWFSHAEATKRIVKQKYSDLSPDEMAIAATEENVLVQLNHLSTHPCVAARLSAGLVQTYGWYYDIGRGRVLEYDQSQMKFVDLGTSVRAASPMPIRSSERDAGFLLTAKEEL